MAELRRYGGLGVCRKRFVVVVVWDGILQTVNGMYHMAPRNEAEESGIGPMN